MVLKKLLPHQGLFVQAPFVFPEVRFLFLISGYAAGKTSALVDLTIKAISHYSGKLDKEGRQPKIGICGITLTFLKKTFVGALVASFRNTRSTYIYDKAHNVIYVAGVELHLTPIAIEEDVYGYDWVCALVDELDELPTYTSVGVVRAINDRCRQSVVGCRPPFLAFATTSQGLKGTYQVVQSLKAKGINYIIIRGRTCDNIHLPPEYIESMYKIYNEKERRCLLEGEFISIDSGLTYPDYDPSRNVLDYSVYDSVKPSDIIYIGQDINCLKFNTLVTTNKGEKKLCKLRPGDLVLTRKGFKKVLTVMCRGVKIVSNYSGLEGTKDHVAITPQGDSQLCQAEKFFCLSKQSMNVARSIQMLLDDLLQWRRLHFKDLFTDDTKSQKVSSPEGIFNAENACCTETSTDTSQEKQSQKNIMSTTKMEETITDSKASNVFQTVHTPNSTDQKLTKIISEEKVPGRMKKQLRKLKSIIAQKKVLRRSSELLKKLGKAERLLLRLLVLTAGSPSKQIYELASAVQSASESIANYVKDYRITESETDYLQHRKWLNQLAGYVVCLLSELQQHYIAASIKSIGNVQDGKERLAEVWDIEVEDAHEFFANGILVHNCGFCRAVAVIVRNGIIYVVKEYNFPDLRRAPEVFRYDFPANEINWIPDATYNMHLPEYKKELRSANIKVKYRSKNPLIKDRVFLVNKMLYAERLLISEECKDVQQALATRQNDPNTGMPMKGKGESAPDHILDAGEYCFAYCAAWLPSLKDLYKASLGRRLENRRLAGLADDSNVSSTDVDKEVAINEDR